MRIYSTAQELTLAAKLLEDDNLVWDNDFDQIREQLSAWLAIEAKNEQVALPAIRLAKQLIKGN